MKTLALLLFSSLALAEDLSPGSYAKIQREQQEAVDAVDKSHGNKMPSELSSSERAEVAREQAAAQQAVLDKHEVDSKAFARFGATLTLDQRSQVKAASTALEKAAAKGPAKGPAEVTVQHGFSNSHPVEMEAKPDAPPVAETGTVDVQKGPSASTPGSSNKKKGGHSKHSKSHSQ